MNIFYSDKKIILDLQSGERQTVDRAFQYLYKAYYKMSLNIVKSNNGNEYEAADVFQDALISFYENVLKGKFRGDSAIKTYLYSVIRNLWLTKIARNKKMVDREGFQDNLKSLTVENQNFSEGETEKLFKDIIARTGENCKELLRMYYYENRSMKEITRLMGFSNENSAKTQKYKCMKKLILFLEKHPDLKKSLLN